MVDIAVVGAGVVGTAIARELSRYRLKTTLIEKDFDVAGEATMANSGIVYNGHTAHPDKLKGKLTLRGNATFDSVCDDLSVPMKRLGILVLGYDEEDRKAVEELYERASANKIPGAAILSKDEVLKKEPLVNSDVTCAFYSPGFGVINPWDLAIAMAENAVDQGVELLLDNEVTSIENLGDFFHIKTSRTELDARIVINCAGIYVDRIYGMVVPNPPFTIIPKRGQYIVLDKNAAFRVNHILSHCKTEKEKGVFIIPTLSGNLLIGPDMEAIEDKEGKETTTDRILHINHSAKKISDKVPMHQVIRSFSGLKAKCDAGDFLIEESKEVQGFINVAGINSPGLTCSPAIAEYVAEIVKGIFDRQGKAVEQKSDFNPKRKGFTRFMDLPDDRKAELIKQNSAYGRVICRCEMITEGDILDVIHRNVGATTVKGVKKRTRAGMGRCQGSFCSPKVVEILARELGKEMNEILMDNENSYLLADPIE